MYWVIWLSHSTFEKPHKLGFYMHLCWPGLGVMTSWLQMGTNHSSPLGGGVGALWFDSEQPKVPLEKPQRNTPDVPLG